MYWLLHRHKHLRTFLVLGAVLFYCTVCVATDLFHTDRCHNGLFTPFAKDDLTEDEYCPACVFSAGYHSTQPQIATPLPCAELIRLSLCERPESVFVAAREWAHAIVLRAPPAITPC
jgi:hypothetical protein